MWVIAAEDRGGAYNATRIADRVYLEQNGWLEEDSLSEVRRWQGWEPSDAYIDLHTVRKTARLSLGGRSNFGGGAARLHGHFDGDPGEPDARMTRELLLTMIYKRVTPALLVIARDADGQERRPGFEQAVKGCKPSFSVVYAGMIPESEAWRIAGFCAEDVQERATLREIAQEIGFSPEQHPERLSARKAEDKRDCKRILDALTGGDEERGRRCLERPLDELARHPCGMSDYIEDLRRFFSAPA